MHDMYQALRIKIHRLSNWPGTHFESKQTSPSVSNGPTGYRLRTIGLTAPRGLGPASLGNLFPEDLNQTNTLNFQTLTIQQAKPMLSTSRLPSIPLPEPYIPKLEIPEKLGNGRHFSDPSLGSAVRNPGFIFGFGIA